MDLVFDMKINGKKPLTSEMNLGIMSLAKRELKVNVKLNDSQSDGNSESVNNDQLNQFFSARDNAYNDSTYRSANYERSNTMM